MSQRLPPLLTITDLHQRFEADYGQPVPLDKFIAYLGRLEDTDAVDVLAFHSVGQEPKPETLVLLDPTRVDAYASARLVAACAGKAKGRVSKWLREELELGEPQRLLSRGYFACTTGPSNAEAVERYLDEQSEHHGYACRAKPPVFVQRYPLTPADEQRLSTQHAVTILRPHVVLCTWRRKGVFGRAEGEAIATRWRQFTWQSVSIRVCRPR